ncbi:hypothetical protein [uncultured Anaeromusa sp.]|uniref:hypothetical protein n=1 Tax=uncultured Anaeromusa sp. TaxID=673273 RepID=UPI0029C92300|nr:hypothetical protein [uncultured Anaeromusa sp.]
MLNNRNEFEKTLVILATVLYFYSVLFDIGLLKPFSTELAFDKDLMTTLFQVQASIATLGIAIISILSGTFKETYYGIPVSHYITHLKPNIFKHKNIIFAELTLLLFSYAFIILTFFNSVVSTFFISTAIIGIMVHDIFKSFQGTHYLKEEISQYCLSFFRNNSSDLTRMNNIYIGINNDIELLVNSNNLLRLKENLNLLIGIIESLHYHNRSSAEEIDLWRQTYINISLMLFKQKTSKVSYIAIKSLDNVLSFPNIQFIHSLLPLWSMLYHHLINCLRTLDDDDSFYLLISLRYKVYSIFRDQPSLISPPFVQEFSTDIYECFLSRNIFFDNSFLNHWKKIMFEEIKRDALHGDNSISKIAHRELCQFSKTIIDHSEEQLINKYIKPLFRKHLTNSQDILYVFKIVIYLYYLAIKETETHASKSQKDIATMLLQDLKDLLPNDNLVFHNSGKFEKEFILEIKDQLSRWEIFENNVVKHPIMDNTIDEYLLFFLLTVENDWGFLSQGLVNIIQDRYFEFYQRYSGPRKKATEKSLETFFTLFPINNISSKNVTEIINRFTNILENLYKKDKLKKTKLDKLNSSNLTDAENNFQQILTKKLEFILEPLSKTSSSQIVQGDQIQSFENYTCAITDHYVEHDIVEYFTYHFINLIKNILLNKLTIKTLSEKDNNMLEIFLKLFNDSDINLNTMIGYRDCFFDRSNFEKFSSLCENLKQIKSGFVNNYVIAIDSSLFYFKIQKVTLSINNLSHEEILEMATKLPDGNYSYNITNDIYFTYSESELVEFLTYARKMINVKVDYEYGFHNSTDKIGVGIIIESK